MAETLSVRHDAPGRRFVARLEGGEAELTYRLSGGTLDLYHTFVPDALRGLGIAERLAQAAFNYARTQGLAVRPSCAYIAGTYLKRHPEHLPLTQAGGGA